MDHNRLVRLLQVATHLLLFYGLYYCFTTSNWMMMLYSVFIYWFIGVFGINIGYHRLISHRSFETYKPIEYILALIGVITTVGSPLAWTALHRQHHGHTETEKDPHSPYQLGWWKAWFGVWKVDWISPKLIKDIRKNKFYKFTHKYYFYIIAAYVACLALIDPIWIVFGYAIPAVLVLHSTSSIIVIAHMHGYKTHDLGHEEARNSWIASLITLGEGWHNNHHANSKAWNNQERWWELDPPAWIIKYLLMKTS